MGVTDGAVFCIAGESAIASRRVPLGQLPVLSRLISLLRRIPAVNWAFNRLRPLPHGGSIDVAPIAADEPRALVADIAETSPGVAIVAAPLREDMAVAPTVPVAAEEPAELSAEVEPEPIEVAALVDSSVACIIEAADVEPVAVENAPASVADDLVPEIESSDPIITESYTEVLADAEPAVIAATSEPLVDAETPVVEIPDLIASEPSDEVAMDAEPAVAEVATTPLPEIESPIAEAPALVVSEPTAEALADFEVVTPEDAPAALIEAETAAIDIPDLAVANNPSPGVAAEVAPVEAEAPPPVLPVAADAVPSASLDVAATSAPVVVALPSPSKRNRAPKTPTRAADPTDRTILIRQRWAETGIKMWNPRIYGTGDATLNIQGRSGLLPPAAGETMPRYDRLEFRMLGGRIVCEGVIVEAPAQAGQRSFTRLAEPVKSTREPVRERQAALA